MRTCRVFAQTVTYGDMDLAGIQNPKAEIVEEFKENVKALREYTSVQYGQKYLIEKMFPYLYVHGKGGWYHKCSIGFSQFNKIRILDCREDSQKINIILFSCLIT